MVDKNDSKKRKVLLVLTITSTLPILLFILVSNYVPVRNVGEILSLRDFVVIAGVINLIAILWLAKALKTLNGIYPVIIAAAALHFTADLIRAISQRASDATMTYLIELDNDIVMIIRIMLLYIGYLVLVALVGFIVRMYVSLALILVIALISSSIPICIYFKILPDKAKARMHDAAFALVVVSMLAVIRFVVGALISFSLAL